MLDLNKLDPQYSTIFLPLDAQSSGGGVQTTRSLSRQPGAPASVTVGDGSTPATYPQQLWRRGELFDGVNYLDLNFAAGGVLDTQTFTVCALVQPERPVADGRIFEIGIAGQRYSLYYDLTTDEVVWSKDDTVPQTLTSDRGAQYGQMFSVCASVSSTGMKLWVDGQLKDSVAGDVRLPNFDATSKAYFGQDVAAGNRFKGRVYVAAVYPFELTTTQVREWGRRARQLRNAGIWTPAALLTDATGVWGDWSTDSEVTYNTQPTVPGGGWSGANWSGSGLGPYTHTTGSTTALANAVLTVGNTYTTVFTVSGRTAGTVTLYAGTTAGTARSTNDTFTETLACAGNTSHSFVPSSDFDGVVTVTTVKNDSLTQASFNASTGTLAGSVLEQATAASMPWWDDDAFGASVGGLTFDGTADYVASDAAASAHDYHKAAGFTFSFPIQASIYASDTRTILDTCDGDPSNVGICVEYDATDDQLVVRVANGTGVWELDYATGAGSLSNESHAVTLSWSESGGMRLLIDSRTAITSATGGSASAADASATLQLGRRSGGTNFWDGSIGAVFARAGAVSSAELAQLHEDLVIRFAITSLENTFTFLTTDTTQSWTIAMDSGYKYWLDWGDGTVDEYTGTGANQNVLHNYAAAGTYEVKFRVQDPSKLKTFHCYSNQLSGTLPSFAACTQLEYFHCASNQFSGTLPSFAACTQLKTFYCYDNQFSGTLPSFAACTLLQIFRCYNNQISGYAGGAWATVCTDWRGQDNNLPQSAVDAVLAEFNVGLGARPVNGTLNINTAATNAAPSAAGAVNAQNIRDHGTAGGGVWTVSHN